MKKLIQIFLAGIWVLSACSTGSKTASLIGDWKLTAYGPVDSPQASIPEVAAVLTFDSKDQVSGNLGCNGFGGKYKVKNDQIVFDAIASTLMACPEPQMQQEQAAFAVLTGNVDYKLEAGILTLTKDGKVLVFEAATPE